MECLEGVNAGTEKVAQIPSQVDRAVIRELQRTLQSATITQRW